MAVAETPTSDAVDVAASGFVSVVASRIEDEVVDATRSDDVSLKNENCEAMGC